ncbi:MAG: hypothetical protein DRP93_07250 [Candidatus Neomarinimicrobiota bacterium]|nr:MAG: hypothetical protein DRP93_07250 [Candidatus Neomarinimicrobiota bacterium]
MMKVYYICHSTWGIISDVKDLLFDYSERICGSGVRGVVMKIFSGRSPLILFSHTHSDHFSPSVSTIVKNAQYILPRDTPEDIARGFSTKVVVPLRGEVTLDGVVIQTFPSTDEGVAYLLELEDGCRIFFAGDLARWVWPDDSEKNRREAERMWKRVLGELEEYNGVDLAFLVADPRLEDLGGFLEIFQVLQPKHTFPIHNFGVFSHYKKLKGLRGVHLPSGAPQEFILGDH